VTTTTTTTITVLPQVGDVITGLSTVDRTEYTGVITAVIPPQDGGVLFPRRERRYQLTATTTPDDLVGTTFPVTFREYGRQCEHCRLPIVLHEVSEWRHRTTGDRYCPAGTPASNPALRAYAAPVSRCPECRSRHYRVRAEAWADRSWCEEPGCGYAHGVSIGD
jgi:hypothetical protein